MRESAVVTPRWRHHPPGIIQNTGNPAKLHQLRKHRGQPQRVDVALARAHTQILIDIYGLSRLAIARAANISIATVIKIHSSPTQKLIDRRTEAAILAVTWAPHPRQAVCLSVGAQRRAHALARIGWPIAWQAAQIGIPHCSYQASLRGQRIAYDIWAAVQDLYNQHSHQPGPSLKARQAAITNGWLAPLDWEHTDIDNPHAQPNPGAGTRRIRPHVVAALVAGQATEYTPDEIRAAFKRLDKTGMTAAEIAARLSIGPRTVRTYRKELRHTKAAA